MSATAKGGALVLAREKAGYLRVRYVRRWTLCGVSLGPAGEEMGESEIALTDTREMIRDELKGRAVSVRV